MQPVRGVRTILGAESAGGVDWQAARRAARQLSDPGELDLIPAEEEAYAEDVAVARTRIEAATGLEITLPGSLEVQNRHHWIDRTAGTLERALDPIEPEAARFPGLTAAVNTGTVAGALAHLSGLVLGQYDPHLFDPGAEHELLVVHPNVQAGARELSVAPDTFRRWIVFHEVAHAAEFAQAPWLPEYLADRMARVLEAVAAGTAPRHVIHELDLAMTAVEGYAELLMDEAFDGPTAALRSALDDRRARSGPVAGIVARLLGLDRKRDQYEQGRAFFAAIAEQRGLQGANRVWERPEHLPRGGEIEDPTTWLDRVGPGE